MINQKFSTSIYVAFLAVVLAFSASVSACAQNLVSGDIAGTVTDPAGAVIPNAKITVTDLGTNLVKFSTTNSSGTYRVSLLTPGSYRVKVEVAGFSTVTTNVDVFAGGIAHGDAKLAVGNSATVVEVTESAPLLHTESAQISTEFSFEQVASLPNPGNDLTFIAQTTPGTIMNTQSGYGNFSSFGLPATANTITINGGYTNDPYLNLSNSGASNLLLGNNDIATVTVINNAYEAQYGGLGGTQLNEITRRGVNKFHGDATYQWNGSVLNGNDYFNNQSGTKRPRSNANQWSGSFGGPIFKDKTFFFFNTEGLRVLIPVRGTVYAPSANFQASVIASQKTASNVAFFKNYFSAYNSPGFAAATADPGDSNVVIYNANASNFAHEAEYTGRIDQKLGNKDNIFIHGTYDNGTQPTFTSLINPVFDALSPQPQYYGQLNETHVFSQNIANQFVFSEIYYKAVFQNTTSAAANAIAPFSVIFISGDLANNGLAETPGGEDFAFPGGRKVNGYQFADDLSYTRGKHTFKGGFYMRRDDVTDLSPQSETTPLLLESESDLGKGQATLLYLAQFPTRLTQPISVYNMGFYLQDQWKVTPALVLTAGIRFEHNSDPVCHTACFSELATTFAASSTSPNTPYNNVNGKGLINTGLSKAFPSFQKVGYEPRFGFAYTPAALGSKTVIRGGFGMFADSFPAQVVDNFLNNAPGNVGYSFVPGSGTSLNPADPTSFQTTLAAGTALFRSGFNSGGSYNTISAADPAFSPPGSQSPVNHISYPTYEEYSLAVQRQVGRTTVFEAEYVGNHTYHQPVLNSSVNAYNGGAPGFPTLPTAPPNGNLGAVTQVYTGAVSNYNGVVLTATKKSSYLTLQFNYAYSHSLDEISNGGFDGFSGNSVSPTNPNTSLLRQNYGNSDYDIRHYISANYVFTLPYYGGPKILTKGWEIAGTVFHSTGLPFTFTDTATSGNDFGNYGGSLFAQQTVKHIPTKCSGSNIENVTLGTGTPCAASQDVTFATNFGQQERNQVFGPGYTDTDMSLYKSISFPKFTSLHLKLGIQAFNLLNHPNFAQPAHDMSNGNLGLISATVNPPTSILGSFLGGDASPRLLQLKTNINF